jgi:2-aminobenzoate-CoA ligase
MHFHRDILTIADTFAKHVLQPKSSDVFAGSPPLAFTFGLGALVIFPFRVGATSLLLEGAPPPVLLKEIAKHGVTTLFTAPTAYRAMLGHLAETPLPNLHTCVSAGEHLPKSTWEAWHQATGIRIIDGIGATEMLHIFISASGDEIIPGMTGKVVPGYDAIVVDEELNEVPDGEVGRLAVKGPTGCRYLHDERQRNYVEGGWNLTGDLYIKHPNGYFQYQSRSDDMIISSGYNVAAPEVENALLLHPAVAECAVVGLPDEERGMIVAAYVVLKSQAQASDELRSVLQNHVKETIVPFKYPRVLEFVTELPKTTTGKLQRFRLKS